MMVVTILLILLASYCESYEKKVDGELILKLLDSKEYDKASVEIKKAFEIEPKCAICYFARGCILEHQGQQLQAMQNYNKAIELSPDYPPYYYFRGKLNMSMGIFQTGSFNKENYERSIRLAIDDFTKGIQLKPGNIDLYYRERGDAYINISLYDKALSDFQKLLLLNKKGTSILCSIGKCYLELNDLDNALKFLLKAKTDEMMSDFCLVDIALAYSMKNEKDNALKYLEMAVSRNEYTANFGLKESDPRWNNIRKTTIFQKVKNGRKTK